MAVAPVEKMNYARQIYCIWHASHLSILLRNNTGVKYGFLNMINTVTMYNSCSICMWLGLEHVHLFNCVKDTACRFAFPVPYRRGEEGAMPPPPPKPYKNKS